MTDARNAMHARRRLLLPVAVALALACGLAPCGAAHAQSAEAKQQYKDHYDRATRLYDVGKYAEAVDAYQRAYLAIEDPNILFNIAQAYRLWDRPDEAVRFYRNFLRKAPGAPNKAAVDRWIAELEKTIEERKRAPSSPPPAVAPPVILPVPPPAAAAPPPTGSSPPPPIYTELPSATAPPATASAAGGLEQKAPPPATPATGGTRTVALVFLITGGALVVTSLVAGAVAADRANKVEQAAKQMRAFDANVEKTGKAANTIAIVSGLVGLGSAATGGILLMAAKPGGGQAAAAGVAAGPSLALAPLLGPGVAGAGARLAF